MSHIPALSLERTEPEAKALLTAVKGQLGMVPNLFATFAHSPKVLEGYLGWSGALGKGHLPAKLREQIALASAGSNGCDYCASAHTALGKGAGLGEEEITLNLQGISEDRKTQTVLSFVRKVVKERARIEAADLESLRLAGYSDGEIVEIIAHIALNLFTNYFNLIVGTEIDFPVVSTDGIARAA